jgi:hypothetical protein
VQSLFWGFESEDSAELPESRPREVQMEIISQLLERMGITVAEALIRGAVVIAVAKLVATWAVLSSWPTRHASSTPVLRSPGSVTVTRILPGNMPLSFEAP